MMGDRLFGQRIGRLVAVGLLAIMLGTGIGFVASGVTVTVSRTDTVAMEDSSTGGRRPGAFNHADPHCDVGSDDESDTMTERDAAKGLGWLVA